MPWQSESTAEELAENPDQLADVVHAAIRGHRLPISITDVKDTICAMTRFGPITDWVLPEEVERLRRLEHGRLLLLLRSRRAVRFSAEAARHAGRAAAIGSADEDARGTGAAEDAAA